MSLRKRKKLRIRPDTSIIRWRILRWQQSNRKWILLKECKTELEMQTQLAIERQWLIDRKFTRVKLRVDKITVTRQTILER